MTDVLRRPLRHDSSRDAFIAEYGEVLAQRSGRPEEAEYRYGYFDSE
ncbi:hypothetical protein [Mycolicibacterium sp.]